MAATIPHSPTCSRKSLHSLMPIQKIAEVISSLNEIVLLCEKTQNRAGYFAALYKRMTIAVAAGILEGAFQDGPRIGKAGSCLRAKIP